MGFTARIIFFLLLVPAGFQPLEAREAGSATLQADKLELRATDSVVNDLQGIVVLCAKAPDSAEFIDRWRDYVRRNNVGEKELGPLIFEVINNAEAYKAKLLADSVESPDDARDRRARTYRRMHRSALAVMR